MSLAALLGIDGGDARPPLGRHAFVRLVVLAAAGHSWALPVDEVHGVLRHAAGDLRALAATLQREPMSARS